MKVLFVDIETSPNVVYAWGLFNQNIGLSQIIEPTRVLCAAWAWEDELIENVTFRAEWGYGGRVKLLQKLYDALDRADVVVHYNGTSFDVPHLNREFIELGWTPPSPYKQVDLYRTVKKMFRFPSNKLAYISDVLDLGDEGKLHTDMSLWTRVLNDDKDARREMEAYNIEDVVLLRDLYTKLLPWIPGHPNTGLYEDSEGPYCIACGGRAIEKRGYAYTQAGKFQRYLCQDCGRWQRGARRLDTTEMREVL